MSGLRSAGAVLLGYLVMVAVVLIASLLLAAAGVGSLGDDFSPSVGHYALNAALSAVAAGLGASVTARLAAERPLRHLGGLAGLLGAMSLLTLAVGSGTDRVPAGWTVLELAVGLAGIGFVARRHGWRGPSRARAARPPDA